MSAEQDQLLAQLLKNKEYPHAEVEMQIFENCNMRCAFCSQDHSASLEQASVESLKQKAQLAIEYMHNNPMKHFRFNIMGGEVFQDSLDDQIFENMLQMVVMIRGEADRLGKTSEFVFTTNLVFENVDRVQKFLARVDSVVGRVDLATSFDFMGRNWGSKQREIFRANVEEFRERVRLVGVILHKPSIQRMIERGDELFDWLYARVPVVFEYYIPDLSRQDLFAPSDEDNLRAWKYLAKNYPEVEPVNRWIRGENTEVRCCSLNRLTILADGSISSCRYFPYKPEDFKTDLDRNSISGMALQFIEEQGCSSCENFLKCGLHCFVQADRAKREKMASCFMKDFFAEVHA